MGRPAYRIDPARLRDLRIEQGLTQVAVAQQVARDLGKPETESFVCHYQRIEETGKTSARYAKALAQVLGIP